MIVLFLGRNQVARTARAEVTMTTHLAAGGSDRIWFSRESREVSSDISGISCLQDRPLVLVVDDDPGMLEGVERLLRQHAYEPILFSCAEAFKNHTDFKKVVCVILDINLNDGSGIELRYHLKANEHFVPVIYMTGTENPAVREAALASGCIAFLIKPFSAQSLIEPLKKASAGFT